MFMALVASLASMTHEILISLAPSNLFVSNSSIEGKAVDLTL